MHRKTIPLLIVVGLGIASIGFADPTGLWQFNGGMTAQIGTDLSLLGAGAASKVAFGTCSQFGAPLINGNDSQIMRFLPFTLATEGIQVYGDLPANGGGSYCNRWTIAMDFCTTSDLSNAFDTYGYSCPFDTSPDLSDDQGEMYFNYNYGNGMQIGAGGRLGGYYSIPTVILQWHRIVITVDQAVGNVKVYFDGSLIGTYASANHTIGNSGVDGKYSLYTGNVVSLILFGSAINGDTGGGYLNSLAIYDHVLTPDQIAALGGPSDGGLPATEPAVGALVRHSEFVAYDDIFNNYPTGTGDVTNAWARNNMCGGCTGGYYIFTSAYNGSLHINHPAYDWDDPDIDVETTGSLDTMYNIPVTGSLEAQVEYVPIFSPDGAQQFIELSTTDAGLDYYSNDPIPAEFQTKLINLYNGSLAIECNGGTGNGTLRVIGYTAQDLTDVRAFLTYDAGATQYHAYYEFNNSGQIIEAPGSPVTLARTKTGVRLECGMLYSGSPKAYDCYVKDLKIYNAVQTTAPTGCVDGQPQRRSTFSSAAGSTGIDGFWPINKPHELDQLYMPGATYDYSGTGTLLVTHNGVSTNYCNAHIDYNTTDTQSAEWKLVIRPQFTATGNGQFFNMKVDGDPISFFLANYNNVASLMFGETNIFSPNPANIVTLATPADQISSMTLIINYDNSTQKYGAYYQVNSDTMVPHPSTQYPLVRGTNYGTNKFVEFQWQAGAGNTDPFTVGLDDYTETCGVQTLIVPPAAVKDWRVF